MAAGVLVAVCGHAAKARRTVACSLHRANLDTPSVIDTAYHPLADGCPPDWASAWGQDRYGAWVEFALDDVTQRLRWIPPGRFRMGSPESEQGRRDNEGPQHDVLISQGFWLFDTPCTQALWEAVMGEDPSRFQSPDRPVERVSWDQVQEFIQRIGGRIPDLGLVLPTEAQWEYACRAGNNTAYSFGDNPDAIDAYAWHKGNSERKYHKIGTRAPNGWGLYDMHGNVAEWTMDQYKEDYFELLEGSPADNPWFKPETLYPRSVRGGSWKDDPEELRCAEREGSESRWKQRDPQLPKSLWWLTDADHVGFRLVRPENPPSDEEIEKYWLEAMDDL
jgi:formylglycine-generating enzyme required for sulfatase activity